MRRALLVVLLLAPLASAQGSGEFVQPPATMYIHQTGLLWPAINTQVPSDVYATGTWTPFFPTQRCVTTGLPGLITGDHSTWYAYHTPGYVDYDVNEGGAPRTHDEPLMAYNVSLAGDAVSLTYYLETDWGMSSPMADPNIVPAPAPQVVVRATLREDAARHVGGANAEGKLIAQGEIRPFHMAGPATESTSEVTPIQVGDLWIYEIRVKMPYSDPSIAAALGYHLRVDAYIENPACNNPDSDHVMSQYVRPYTDADYRPRFEWVVENPLRIETLTTELVDKEIVVRASAQSVWGNYDLSGDQQGEELPSLTISGPAALAPTLVRYDVDTGSNPSKPSHGAHAAPAELEWRWSLSRDAAPNGTYVAEVVVTNDQGTRGASATIPFTVYWTDWHNETLECLCDRPASIDNPDSVQEAPLPWLLVVAALSLALRRRL